MYHQHPHDIPPVPRDQIASPLAMMPEFRHMRSGSLSIPSGGPNSNTALPRSPPNTSHVPCKFFRQGACQAGNACPFSHDLGAASENICKYFAKGNCKFGPKCANIHILPDGRRINYGKNGVTIGPTPINLGSRSSTNIGSPNAASGTAPYTQSTASALTSSLYRADSPYIYDERHQSAAGSLQHGPDSGLPSIDAPYSPSIPIHGSPRDDDPARLVYCLSPANGGKGLSVLDAPLPASFDSNGISNAARYPAAPWPSSVPSRFGFDPISPSLSSIKDLRPNETLKLLHTSAFGSEERLATPTASSPPNSHQPSVEEYFGRRTMGTMHSSRYSKPKFLSSSVPQTISVDRDWDPEFAFDDGENLPVNLVPGDLQDLLTPLEKARRGSMRGEQSDMSIDGVTKFGSPIGTSPSRWNSFFRQKEEEELGRAARTAAGSAFGHVGSPLRNSTLAQEADASFRGSGSLHRSTASIRSGSEALSALSQQLQCSRLNESIASYNAAQLAANRAPVMTTGLSSKDRAMERHVSTGSISSSVTGRFTTPIDEEDPAFVFRMEEEEGSHAPKTYKRTSVGLNLGGFSYASAVANKGTSNGKGSPEGDSVPVNSQ